MATKKKTSRPRPSRNRDRAVEEDEGMDPGEVWSREEEVVSEKPVGSPKSRRTADRFYEEDDDPGEPGLEDEEEAAGLFDDEERQYR